eukprot:PhM_4_TR17359/c0_g1_i1/m.78079
MSSEGNVGGRLTLDMLPPSHVALKKTSGGTNIQHQQKSKSVVNISTSPMRSGDTLLMSPTVGQKQQQLHHKKIPHHISAMVSPPPRLPPPHSAPLDYSDDNINNKNDVLDIRPLDKERAAKARGLARAAAAGAKASLSPTHKRHQTAFDAFSDALDDALATSDRREHDRGDEGTSNNQTSDTNNKTVSRIDASWWDMSVHLRKLPLVHETYRLVDRLAALRCYADDIAQGTLPPGVSPNDLYISDPKLVKNTIALVSFDCIGSVVQQLAPGMDSAFIWIREAILQNIFYLPCSTLTGSDAVSPSGVDTEGANVLTLAQTLQLVSDFEDVFVRSGVGPHHQQPEQPALGGAPRPYKDAFRLDELVAQTYGKLTTQYSRCHAAMEETARAIERENDAHTRMATHLQASEWYIKNNQRTLKKLAFRGWRAVIVQRRRDAVVAAEKRTLHGQIKELQDHIDTLHSKHKIASEGQEQRIRMLKVDVDGSRAIDHVHQLEISKLRREINDERKSYHSRETTYRDLQTKLDREVANGKRLCLVLSQLRTERAENSFEIANRARVSHLTTREPDAELLLSWVNSMIAFMPESTACCLTDLYDSETAFKAYVLLLHALSPGHIPHGLVQQTLMKPHDEQIEFLSSTLEMLNVPLPQTVEMLDEDGDVEAHILFLSHVFYRFCGCGPVSTPFVGPLECDEVAWKTVIPTLGQRGVTLDIDALEVDMHTTKDANARWKRLGVNMQKSSLNAVVNVMKDQDSMLVPLTSEEKKEFDDFTVLDTERVSNMFVAHGAVADDQPLLDGEEDVAQQIDEVQRGLKRYFRKLRRVYMHYSQAAAKLAAAEQQQQQQQPVLSPSGSSILSPKKSAKNVMPPAAATAASLKRSSSVKGGAGGALASLGSTLSVSTTIAGTSEPSYLTQDDFWRMLCDMRVVTSGASLSATGSSTLDRKTVATIFADVQRGGAGDILMEPSEFVEALLRVAAALPNASSDMLPLRFHTLLDKNLFPYVMPLISMHNNSRNGCASNNYNGASAGLDEFKMTCVYIPTVQSIFTEFKPQLKKIFNFYASRENSGSQVEMEEREWVKLCQDCRLVGEQSNMQSLTLVFQTIQQQGMSMGLLYFEFLEALAVVAMQRTPSPLQTAAVKVRGFVEQNVVGNLTKKLRL